MGAFNSGITTGARWNSRTPLAEDLHPSSPNNGTLTHTFGKHPVLSRDFFPFARARAQWFYKQGPSGKTGGGPSSSPHKSCATARMQSSASATTPTLLSVKMAPLGATESPAKFPAPAADGGKSGAATGGGVDSTEGRWNRLNGPWDVTIAPSLQVRIARLFSQP